MSDKMLGRLALYATHAMLRSFAPTLTMFCLVGSDDDTHSACVSVASFLLAQLRAGTHQPLA